jgi:hypothetical protein
LLDLCIIIMKLLISFLDSKLVLALESHISFRLEIQSPRQLINTPRLDHATLQFLGAGGDDSLEWQMFVILDIIPTI